MFRVFATLLVCGAALLAVACSPQTAARQPAKLHPETAGDPSTAWTSDNGNGTYSNPLFYEEFEDPDVLRVGSDYYLAGTTMHMNPGLMIMHSRDLVNWKLASYCIDRLDFGPAYRLENGNIYGKGIWAPCIRYHNGVFYVFSNVNGAALQVFRSTSANGPWQRSELPGRHDLSVLFDDDGKIYLVSGNHNPYTIEEINSDFSGFVPGARHVMNAPGLGEGHHLYKIHGQYFDVSAVPGASTDQMVARADSIDGPWTVARMVQAESLGTPSQAPLRPGAQPNPNERGLTLHQGGIVDTPSGQWWSIIMQDHGSIGRMVGLVPVTWDNDFPIIGLPGNLRKAPNTWIKPDTGFVQAPAPAFIHSDNFNGRLNPLWQWNHVPDDSQWSLTEKRGVLRLHALPAADFYMARDSLCQRPPGPESIMTVQVDAANLASGDVAGLGLLSRPYAWIGVVKSGEGVSLQMMDASGPAGAARGGRGAVDPAPSVTTAPMSPPARLWLRVHCNFDTDEAIFSWSADGENFLPLGNPFTMRYQLQTFQGVRPALFTFNTAGKRGGYADFDNYVVDEPRARGIERAIPMGHTIVLTSSADGAMLAGDAQHHSLIDTAAAAGTVPEQARFKVLDLGLGRVALQCADGRYVSVGDGGVLLKDLAGGKPALSETFQWINLMRGDTMLMTLTDHRYLATHPGSPGPVTADATGPRPDRKGGACFKWQVVQ